MLQHCLDALHAPIWIMLKETAPVVATISVVAGEAATNKLAAMSSPMAGLR
jgi:hypothetical protein